MTHQAPWMVCPVYLKNDCQEQPSTKEAEYHTQSIESHDGGSMNDKEANCLMILNTISCQYGITCMQLSESDLNSRMNVDLRTSIESIIRIPPVMRLMGVFHLQQGNFRSSQLYELNNGGEFSGLNFTIPTISTSSSLIPCTLPHVQSKIKDLNAISAKNSPNDSENLIASAISSHKKLLVGDCKHELAQQDSNGRLRQKELWQVSLRDDEQHHPQEFIITDSREQNVQSEQNVGSHGLDATNGGQKQEEVGAAIPGCENKSQNCSESMKSRLGFFDHTMDTSTDATRWGLTNVKIKNEIECSRNRTRSPTKQNEGVSTVYLPHDSDCNSPYENFDNKLKFNTNKISERNKDDMSNTHHTVGFQSPEHNENGIDFPRFQKDFQKIDTASNLHKFSEKAQTLVTNLGHSLDRMGAYNSSYTHSTSAAKLVNQLKATVRSDIPSCTNFGQELVGHPVLCLSQNHEAYILGIVNDAMAIETGTY